MKAAIFSDIHGNLIALEKFVYSTKKFVDAYICIGDVVDYGPWNDECLECIYGLPGLVYLQGNHERLFLGAEDLRNEIPLVQSFFHHSYHFFSRPDLIQSLPEHYDIGRFRCTHTINNRSIYPDTQITVDQDYFVGHSHFQYNIQRSGFIIVNPGSIGQNREWINQVNYAVLDTDNFEIKLHSLSYDIDKFISELYARHYPIECIEYYQRKPTK